MALSLISLMDGLYYLVHPDGTPGELDFESLIVHKAYTIDEVTFFDDLERPSHYARINSRLGLRVMRIRKAWSAKGTFLYSEWVPSDEQSMPSTIGVEVIDEMLFDSHNLYEG